MSSSPESHASLTTAFADKATISMNGAGAGVFFQDGATVYMGDNCKWISDGGTTSEAYIYITDNASFRMGSLGTIQFGNNTRANVTSWGTLAMRDYANMAIGAGEGESGTSILSVSNDSRLLLGAHSTITLGGETATGKIALSANSRMSVGAGSDMSLDRGGIVSIREDSLLYFGDDCSLVLAEGANLELNNTRAEAIQAGSNFRMDIQRGATLTAGSDYEAPCTTERNWAMMDLNGGTLSIGTGDGDGKVEVYFEQNPLAEGRDVLWIATGISNTVDTGSLTFNCHWSVELAADDMVFVQQGRDLFMVKNDADTLYRTRGSGSWNDSSWSAYTGEGGNAYDNTKIICFSHVLSGEESITVDGNEEAASVFVSMLSDISLVGQGSLSVGSMNVTDQSKLSIATMLNVQTVTVSGASGLDLGQAGNIGTLSLEEESRLGIRGAARIDTLQVESGSTLLLGSGAVGFSITGQTGAQDITWTGGAGIALLSAGDTPRATEGDLHLGTLSISADTAVHAGGSANTLHIGTMVYDTDGAQAADYAPALYLEGAGLQAEDGNKIILDWGGSNPKSVDDRLWIATGLPEYTDILDHMATSGYNFADGSSWNNAYLLLEHDNLYLTKIGTANKKLYWLGDANGNGTWSNSTGNTPWATYTVQDGSVVANPESYGYTEGETVYFSGVHARNGASKATLSGNVKVDNILLSKGSNVTLDATGASLYAKQVKIDHSTLDMSGQKITLIRETPSTVPRGSTVANELVFDGGTLALDENSLFRIDTGLDLKNATIALKGEAGQHGAAISISELVRAYCESEEILARDYGNPLIIIDDTSTIDFSGSRLVGYSGGALQITESIKINPSWYDAHDMPWLLTDEANEDRFSSLDKMNVTGLENVRGWETSRLSYLIEGKQKYRDGSLQENLYLIKSGKDDLYWTMNSSDAEWSAETDDRWVLGYKGTERVQDTSGRNVHFSQEMIELGQWYPGYSEHMTITVTGTVRTGDISVESDFTDFIPEAYAWGWSDVNSLNLTLGGDEESAIEAQNLHILGSFLYTATENLTINGNVDLTGYGKWEIADRQASMHNVSGNGVFISGIPVSYENGDDAEWAATQRVEVMTFTPDFNGLVFIRNGTLDLVGSPAIGDWNALSNPYQVYIGSSWDGFERPTLELHHAQKIDLSEHAREMAAYGPINLEESYYESKEYQLSKHSQYYETLGVQHIFELAYADVGYLNEENHWLGISEFAGFVLGGGSTLRFDGQYMAGYRSKSGVTESGWDYIDADQALLTIKNSNVVMFLTEWEGETLSCGIEFGDDFKYRCTGPAGYGHIIPLIKIETTDEFDENQFGFFGYDTFVLDEDTDSWIYSMSERGDEDSLPGTYFINEEGQICKWVGNYEDDEEPYKLVPLTFTGPSQFSEYDNHLYYDQWENMIYIIGRATEKRKPIWEGDDDNKGYWTLLRENYYPWHLNEQREYITNFIEGEDVWFNKCCGTDEKPAQAIIESVVKAGRVTLEESAVVEWQKSGEYSDSILKAREIVFETGVKLTSTVDVTVETPVYLNQDSRWTIGAETAEMRYITGATGSGVTIKEDGTLHLTGGEASTFHGLENGGTILMQDGGKIQLEADSESKFQVGDVKLEGGSGLTTTITTEITGAGILDPADPRVTVTIGQVTGDSSISLVLGQAGGNGEVDYRLTADDTPIRGHIVYGADTDTGSANVVLTGENVASEVSLEDAGRGNVVVEAPHAYVISIESADSSASGKVYGTGTPDGNNLLTITGGGKDHISGSMLGENLDIAYTGTGIQGFQGTDGFKGSITVDDKKEDGAAKLSIWGEQNKVDITNLTLGASDSLSLGTDSTAAVSGVLTSLGGPTEHRISDQSTASTVSGHLVLAEGSTLNVSQAMGTGGLNLDGHVLTLGTGSLLYDEDYRLITELTEGKVYDLAFHVQQLEIDNGGQILTFSEDIDASTVFSNITETGTYFIHYTGEANGGQGDNTGTVYIYKDDVIKLIWESSEVCGELSHAGIWDAGQQDNLAWHKNDKRQATYYFTNGNDVWFNKCCATENHPAISSIQGTVIAGTVTLEESAIVNWVEAEGGSSLTARQLIVEHDVHLTSSVDVTVKDNTEGAPPTRVLLGERATWNIEEKTVTLDYITGAEGSGVTIGKTGTLALQERAAASLFHGLENDGTILMQAGGTIQLVADTKNTFKVGNVEIDNNAGADTTTITTATPGDAVTVVEVGSVVSLTQGSDNVKLALEQDGNGTVDYRLTENNAPIQGRIRYGAAPGSPTPDSSANVVLTGENVAAKAVLENTGRGNVVVVAESAKVMALESDQAFPAVSGGKVYGTPAESGSEQVNHRLEITGDGTHNYAGALGGNLDIAYTGTGTQAFGGADGFYGSITVNDGQNSTTADLEVLGQQSRLNITDLTIGSMDKLGMAEGGTAYVEQKLTALGGPTRDNVGTASTVSGNLVIMDNAMIDVSAAQGLGGLNLENHSLTISGNAYLSEADITYLITMEIGAKYDLAYNVSELVLGGMKWEAGDPGEVTEQNDASRYFHLYPGEFYVCYLPGSAEDMIKGEVGNGHNVGTVCLVKAAPEPATATLSLLALAALAARRRRTR